MIYRDSSAVVKLVRREAETEALRGWLASNAQPLVSSALVRTETARALTRTEPAALTVLPSVLALLHQRSVTDDILSQEGQALAGRQLADVHEDAMGGVGGE